MESAAAAVVTRVDLPQSQPSLREQLRDNLIRHEYRGLELQWVEWLRHRVPAEFKENDELRQQVSFFALEAIEIFDPNRNTAFSTFLMQHLRLRCGNYQQYLWVRSSGNEKCQMLRIKQPDRSAGRGVNAEAHPQDGHDVNDGGQYRYKELSVGSRAESICCVKEMVEALSDESRDYLNRLFDFEDQEALIAAFQTKHFRAKVSQATGLSKRQVQVLAEEVQLKYPDFLGV